MIQAILNRIKTLEIKGFATQKVMKLHTRHFEEP